LEAGSNMLCHVFELPSDPNNFYLPVAYPPVVAFMAQAAPSDTPELSRKLHLIRTWERLGCISISGSEKRTLKIATLASIPQQDTKL